MQTPPATPTDAAVTSPPREPSRQPTFGELFHGLADRVEEVILGKRTQVELSLICLLSGGHLLIEDVPGVGKTSLAKALAVAIDGSMGRIQFTPDLMPSDVTGTTIFHRETSQFEFRAGPVFNNVLLADEINRAAPKAQSALLEAMAEAQVSVDGTTHDLPDPFLVIATQNPLEHDGTYPLPESQLDRFTMRLSLGYPAREAELAVLADHAVSDPLDTLEPATHLDTVRRMARTARDLHVEPSIRSYVVDLAESTRRHHAVSIGASPRAGLALLRAARVAAAVAGRTFVTPDDVKFLAPSIWGHRIILRHDARLGGTSGSDVVSEALSTVPAPR